MSSAWADSWGGSWADSWGTITVAAALPQGGGTSRLLRRGRIPKRYADIDLQAVYRKYRGEPEPPEYLMDAAQAVAEGLANPTNPEVMREELATTLLPFVRNVEFLAKASDVRKGVDWLAMVQDQAAMQKLIQMQMDADEDEDDTLLMTIH